ncbi:MAG: hypothetical protein H0T76_20235 [Nannocystis sp.]|nr:hypothetical protein [Nannocystis sp.]MBA3548818.1 hypothetical protein [Nannocystis sp.]
MQITPITTYQTPDGRTHTTFEDAAVHARLIGVQDMLRKHVGGTLRFAADIEVVAAAICATQAEVAKIFATDLRPAKTGDPARRPLMDGVLDRAKHPVPPGGVDPAKRPSLEDELSSLIRMKDPG